MKLFLLLLCFVSLNLFGQDLQVLLTHSQEIDPERYLGVKGSPYFFKEFVRGDIISNSAETFENMILNYNAETREFEIINGDKTIQLYKPMYMRVEVYPEQNPELGLKFPVIFQRGFNVKWFDKFGQMVYDGEKIKLIKDFKIDISSNEVQNVGNTVKFKRFDEEAEYFLLVEGELSSIKLKKKKILAELKYSEKLEQFARDNKIDFSSEVGLRMLLSYYETLN